MKTIGDTVEEIIKAGRYSTGAIIDKVAGREVPPDFSPSLTNSLANTLAAACEKLEADRARIKQLEAALRWYEENVRNCAKLGGIREGDDARAALSEDAGDIARKALDQ